MDELAFHRAMARPGTILDIGAHEGALTLPLAAIPGMRVIAFEPLPPAFARLEQAVRARHGGMGENIELRQVALGARRGTVALEVPVVGGVAHEQWASVVKDYAAIRRYDPRIDGISRFDVRMERLDDLGLSDVTAIKLDAEGAEEEVLRGGAGLLRRCAPVLSVEIEERHRTGSTQVVPALLAGLGYAGFFVLNGAWREIAAFDAGAMQRASPSPASFEASDPYVFLFYFVPLQRRAELLRLAAG